MKIFFTFLFVITSSLISYGQENSELIRTLKKELPEKSNKDGRWVFYENEANIEKLEKPKIEELFPEVEFYKIMLTNYLGYHIEQSNCLILYNTSKSKILLVEPIWYNDLDKKFLKKFIGIKFTNTQSLSEFVGEIQELILVGSRYEIRNSKLTKAKITFDLTYEVRSKIKIWRSMEILTDDNELVGFSSTNPVTKETTTIK